MVDKEEFLPYRDEDFGRFLAIASSQTCIYIPKGMPWLYITELKDYYSHTCLGAKFYCTGGGVQGGYLEADIVRVHPIRAMAGESSRGDDLAGVYQSGKGIYVALVDGFGDSPEDAASVVLTNLYSLADSQVGIGGDIYNSCVSEDDWRTYLDAVVRELDQLVFKSPVVELPQNSGATFSMLSYDPEGGIALLLQLGNFTCKFSDSEGVTYEYPADEFISDGKAYTLGVVAHSQWYRGIKISRILLDKNRNIQEEVEMKSNDTPKGIFHTFDGVQIPYAPRKSSVAARVTFI